MRIRSNTRVELGRLFACLEFGERVAHDCALRQVEISEVMSNRRFLVRQAQQELHHGQVFGKVILCLTPRGARPVPTALHQFRTGLERACGRRDLLESLVGQQIVLESFGELVLHKLNNKLDQRHVGFRRLRRTVLHQEHGHRAFGERVVGRLVAQDSVLRARAYDIAEQYLDLIDTVIDQLQPLFEVVEADAGLYKAELRARMPRWREAARP